MLVVASEVGLGVGSLENQEKRPLANILIMCVDNRGDVIDERAKVKR
jgi:hypothetical protein